MKTNSLLVECLTHFTSSNFAFRCCSEGPAYLELPGFRSLTYLITLVSNKSYWPPLFNIKCEVGEREASDLWCDQGCYFSDLERLPIFSKCFIFSGFEFSRIRIMFPQQKLTLVSNALLLCCLVGSTVARLSHDSSTTWFQAPILVVEWLNTCTAQ